MSRRKLRFSCQIIAEQRGVESVTLAVRDGLNLPQLGRGPSHARVDHVKCSSCMRSTRATPTLRGSRLSLVWDLDDRSEDPVCITVPALPCRGAEGRTSAAEPHR